MYFPGTALHLSASPAAVRNCSSLLQSRFPCLHFRVIGSQSTSHRKPYQTAKAPGLRPRGGRPSPLVKGNRAVGRNRRCSRRSAIFQEYRARYSHRGPIVVHKVKFNIANSPNGRLQRCRMHRRSHNGCAPAIGHLCSKFRRVDAVPATLLDCFPMECSIHRITGCLWP